ncbi:hypothetical protein HID58_007421 [Brassica napus]|uniref:Uncharacterized protein n=2 Tax=Brassica napus TaxID=3708 RepID=A0ABQ8EEB8_BRANA|nr:hypothetical protein HID58_007421 [Brassica napus]
MPRGVRETSEDALVALQDDTHNQVVARSVMVRIETYVVEDDSDYESTPNVPANDEYISEDELDEACTDSDSESDSSSYQKRRDNRQPSYMSDAHWATMVEKYNTEQAKKKSAKAAKSRKSAPVGKKMHKHGAGPRCFLNIQYNMMVDEGLDEPPSYTALARKTHTGKDGSFLDERTEELVLEVEEAVEEMLQDGSPHGDSQTDSTAASNAKRYLLNQEYIKRGKTKKGTIYGLDSAQYKNSSPSVPIPVSLKRNLDVDMRMSGFETTISEVKEDIAGVKEDFTALKTEINAFKTEVTGGMSASQATLNIILQTLQSQASTPASTAQPFQPQAQPQAPVQSHHQPQPQAQSTAPPQHLSTNTHSDLDRWCQELDM